MEIHSVLCFTPSETIRPVEHAGREQSAKWQGVRSGSLIWTSSIERRVRGVPEIVAGGTGLHRPPAVV